MREIGRRTLAGWLGAGIAVPTVLRSTKTRAAEFSFKYANGLPASHPVTLQMRQAVDAIRAESGGKVEIGVFPTNVLGGDTDLLSQLRSGALEFASLSPLFVSALVPTVAITGLGFAWPGYDPLWRALDGDLGAFVRAEIGKARLHAFDRFFDNGFRQITNSARPIARVEDLEGLKLRVPVVPLFTSMFSALGASPLSINFSETYTALQTRIADGQENPLAVVETAKLFEVQKYLSITNHMWDGYVFLSGHRVWNGVPAEVQSLITKHVNAAALRERADTLALNATLQEKLKRSGMLVNEAETAGFRSKLRTAGFYGSWREKFGREAWTLLEKHTGPIS